ncbi:helix-turn-helix domain-containing protein [Nocardia sp. NPDC058058]|uniref:AraC family transcriptional regulator n=1 Tax=Nocardia sp. NPDC058058 TaxID=3346317 RepID=UPI0036DE4266
MDDKTLFIEMRRAELASNDAEETIAYVTEMYADNQLRFHRAAPRSQVRTNTAVCEQIMATKIRSTLGYSCRIEPIRDHVYFQRTLGGRIRLRGDGHDLRQQRNELAVYPIGSTILTDCESHDTNLLHIPYGELADAAAQSGIDTGAFRFTSLVPIDARRERMWGRLFDLVHHEVTAPDSVLTELIVQNLTRTLAATALSVFPNTGMDAQPRRGPGAVPATALQRAVDYLRANPLSPTTVTELATHAGTSPRALQYAFRTEYQMNPMDYLRQLRLEHARQDLLAAEPSDGYTVAIVAARWGFGNPGRFAQHYKRVFGHPPSQALRH